MKKICSLVLVLLLTIASVSFADTSKIEYEKIELNTVSTNQFFEEASDDTIVLYIEGIPITKGDIKKNKIMVPKKQISQISIRSLPDLYRLPLYSHNAAWRKLLIFRVSIK